MEKKMKCYRQGELCFIPVKVPENFKESVIGKKITNNVIREGEVTGHMHRASSNALLTEVNSSGTGRQGVLNYWKDGASFELPQGQMYLTADNTIEITHDEHKTLKLDKGEYIIRIQREYDEEQDRLIAD